MGRKKKVDSEVPPRSRLRWDECRCFMYGWLTVWLVTKAYFLVTLRFKLPLNYPLIMIVPWRPHTKRSQTNFVTSTWRDWTIPLNARQWPRFVVCGKFSWAWSYARQVRGSGLFLVIKVAFILGMLYESDGTWLGVSTLLWFLSAISFTDFSAFVARAASPTMLRIWASASFFICCISFPFIYYSDMAFLQLCWM